jgi:hypothetical protein
VAFLLQELGTGNNNSIYLQELSEVVETEPVFKGTWFDIFDRNLKVIDRALNMVENI